MPLYSTFSVSVVGFSFFLSLFVFFSLNVFVWVIHSASFTVCR